MRSNTIQRRFYDRSSIHASHFANETMAARDWLAARTGCCVCILRLLAPASARTRHGTHLTALRHCHAVITLTSRGAIRHWPLPRHPRSWPARHPTRQRRSAASLGPGQPIRLDLGGPGYWVISLTSIGSPAPTGRGGSRSVRIGPIRAYLQSVATTVYVSRTETPAQVRSDRAGINVPVSVSRAVSGRLSGSAR